MSLCRLIKHTKQLLEENEERLCIKVLQTLREMMTKDRGYGEKVGEAAKCRCHVFAQWDDTLNYHIHGMTVYGIYCINTVAGNVLKDFVLLNFY